MATSPSENSAPALLPARLWLPLAVAVVIAASVLVVSELSYRWFTGAQAGIRQGLELQAKLLQLQKTVVEAETAQRGYLLSRKSVYLEPFRQSVDAIRPQQRELLDLAFQDKGMRDRLSELNQLIALKLS